MIARAGLRWRLVAWVSGAMLLVCAIVFVVVYQQTGSQLRAQVAQDVRGDVTQLSQTLRTLRSVGADRLAARLRRYIDSQPYSDASSLLFAVLPGHGTITNYPELFGAARPDDGETLAEQRRENAQGHALLAGPLGARTAPAPDVGPIQLDERALRIAGIDVRVGAAESLQTVTRAQRTVARSFLLAGALALVLVLAASYLAGALATRPIRRLAAVAAHVDHGELAPRMPVSHRAAAEIRTLADSFNHMLDRLAAAFSREREFVADASHELRTPLTVIAGQLELLTRISAPTAEELARTHRLVAAEVSRTSRLVDDMLLLTRSGQADFLRRGPIELPQFVGDLWDTTIAGHDRRFELGPVPEAVLVADSDRLAQALRNLLDNAIAHAEPGHGLVSLTVSTLPRRRIRFTVADDGPGIAPDQRELVFERFHRTDAGRDRRTGGAGLGLSIVRAIADAHGGRVVVADAPVGARLELELPGLATRAPDGGVGASPTPVDRRLAGGRDRAPTRL